MRLEGRVKWYSAIRGFGVIETFDGRSIFTHKKQISGHLTLKDGDHVSFFVTTCRNKTCAVAVELVVEPAVPRFKTV